ncbi:hypothetical protein TTHERM_000059528 (macronuclear) [Tetrahymena thermophila SB210]|uniref:Uncharacterized protein n=1 Tax=Tetrahymena thermophila (strain SB210) TaxID=312017 RepID=W7XAT3_TETTS|nr:hypothetical protein TTHERM_000059528 [Tetrahymena thermophila SB210]EWS76485.1 hypothetical protein TTHERM_000059528 [Tetrahymena thermophila SB210]|eukprot:XP_012650985.1 hypothetical protein TTHERM_000059528 [Tetrahymena thermophila SB210]
MQDRFNSINQFVEKDNNHYCMQYIYYYYQYTKHINLNYITNSFNYLHLHNILIMSNYLHINLIKSLQTFHQGSLIHKFHLIGNILISIMYINQSYIRNSQNIYLSIKCMCQYLRGRLLFQKGNQSSTNYCKLNKGKFHIQKQLDLVFRWHYRSQHKYYQHYLYIKGKLNHTMNRLSIFMVMLNNNLNKIHQFSRFYIEDQNIVSIFLFHLLC